MANFYKEFCNAYKVYNQDIFGERGLFSHYENMLENKANDYRLDKTIAKDELSVLMEQLYKAEEKLRRKATIIASAYKKIETEINSQTIKNLKSNTNALLAETLSKFFNKDYVAKTLPLVFQVYTGHGYFSKEKPNKYHILKKECIITPALAHALSLKAIDESADYAAIEERYRFQTKLQKWNDLFFANLSPEECVTYIIPENYFFVANKIARTNDKNPIQVKLKRTEDEQKIFKLRDKQLERKASSNISEYFWSELVPFELVFDFYHKTMSLANELGVTDKEKYVESLIWEEEESQQS